MKTTFDAFLGGRLEIEQPSDGYRAGMDPVLLAAACPALPGDRVLDLGCGVGTAALCLAARIPTAQLSGVDLQEPYADLAVRNAAANGFAMTVEAADVTARPTPFSGEAFHHVITNPPYFDPKRTTPAQDDGKAMGRSGQIDLSAWLETAYKRLIQGGWLTLIYRMDRLPEVLGPADAMFGTISVLPLAPRPHKQPNLFLLRARKGGRAAFEMMPSLTIHTAERHQIDNSDYSEIIRKVLQDGAELPWGR